MPFGIFPMPLRTYCLLCIICHHPAFINAPVDVSKVTSTGEALMDFLGGLQEVVSRGRVALLVLLVEHVGWRRGRP